MVVLATPIAVSSSSDTAVFGLVGVLVGGAIASAVSVWVAWQARKSAERAWIRDSRRQIYDRFLMSAQTLQIACEAAPPSTGRPGRAAWRWRTRPETKGAKASIDAAHMAFFGAYGMVLAIADSALVAAARDYAYQLWELKSMLDSPYTSVMDPENFEAVDKAIRLARHGTVDAIRAELKVRGSARPEKTNEKYNPFRDDRILGPKYAAGRRDRPGSAV